VLYKQIEDKPLKLDACIPINGDNAPAVLVLFGGGWRHGNRKQLKNYATKLADRGLARRAKGISNEWHCRLNQKR